MPKGLPHTQQIVQMWWYAQHLLNLKPLNPFLTIHDPEVEHKWRLEAAQRLPNALNRPLLVQLRDLGQDLPGSSCHLQDVIVEKQWKHEEQETYSCINLQVWCGNAHTSLAIHVRHTSFIYRMQLHNIHLYTVDCQGFISFSCTIGWQLWWGIDSKFKNPQILCPFDHSTFQWCPVLKTRQ